MLGWDALRGLCALAVALYHLLHWQGIATLHTLGSYGVYLFFGLSGASLAYNYSGRMRRRGDYASFLLTRWLRLAPLYALVCLASALLFSLRHGAWVDQLFTRLLLNVSFAFGAYDPATSAMAIGGWSLGIEFIYYLAFPLLLPALSRPRLCFLLGLSLCVLQWTWIYQTAGSEAGYAAAAVQYHQVPAFAGYFFGGCVIGHWRARRRLDVSGWAGVVACAAMAVLLVGLNPERQGDELLALRGGLLFAACFAIVGIAGHARVARRLVPVARWLGDVTYGCYLLHPLIFFAITWFLLPRLGWGDIGQRAAWAPWAWLAAVLALSCAAAWAGERWFEGPIRRWGKRVLGARLPPSQPGYKAAANISS